MNTLYASSVFFVKDAAPLAVFSVDALIGTSQFSTVHRDC